MAASAAWSLGVEQLKLGPAILSDLGVALEVLEIPAHVMSPMTTNRHPNRIELKYLIDVIMLPDLQQVFLRPWRRGPNALLR